MADVLLMTKRDEWSGYAAIIAKSIFGERLEVATGKSGERFPGAIAFEPWPIIISFLAPWVVPAHVLDRAQLAINFHPGSAKYPGIGCYNFALYEAASEYGAVCHHMRAAVDTGPIIADRLFSVFMGDTVASLKVRTMAAMLDLFREIIEHIEGGFPLATHRHQWSRRPFTRRELDELCRLTPDMSDEEVRKRIRATTFPGAPGPFIELGGRRFVAS